LRERLEGRGQDSAEVIAKRLAEAELEMTHYTISDFMVVNDDFATALGELQTIVQAHRLSTQNQAQKHSSLLCDLIPSHTLRNK
jgi:guanylate kinase